MPKKPESKRQLKIRKALEATVGGRWKKIHGGPFQPCMLDLVGCVKGLYFEFEVKEPGEQPTARQLYEIELVIENGGVSMTITTAEEAIDAVRKAIRLSKSRS
jgi:hypothetical protein